MTKLVCRDKVPIFEHILNNFLNLGYGDSGMSGYGSGGYGGMSTGSYYKK